MNSHRREQGLSKPAGLAVAALGVTKRFPGVVANDRVTFETAVGEVHALLGENGAGKTTLCSILTGLYRPDEGELRLGDDVLRLRSPRDAHAAGIFMVHQNLRLVESMTVAENVVLGWSRRGSIGFSPGQVERDVAEVAARYTIPVNPAVRIWQLSMGERQRVEILKGLYRGARILILDEPTSVLTPQEADQLFASVREMAAGGGTVVFISHKLPEVLAVADRITILRRGRSVATIKATEADVHSLARLMVGHDVPAEAVADTGGAPVARPPVLEVDAVSARGDLGLEALSEVSLTVGAGEILAMAGVAGNGQRELAEVIAGLRSPARGTIRVEGEELTPGDPRAAIDRGVAYIPEDRMRTGVSPNLSITDNLILKAYRDRTLRLGPLVSRRKAAARAREMMDRFDIRASGPDTLVRQLSGGNVQRVVLARELSAKPRVIVASSPTRGLDVSATHDIRTMLIEAAAAGTGILLISEDLDEIVQLADRVAVLYEGRVVGVVERSAVTMQQLGLMMAGAAA